MNVQDKTTRTKSNRVLRGLFFGFKYKLRHFLVGLSLVTVLIFGVFWMWGFSPLSVISRLGGAFETKPAFGFVAVEGAFESFQSMSCGDQAWEAALLTGDTSDNPLANLFSQDLVAGQASGVVSIAVRFDGIDMMSDHDSKTVVVTVPGDAYVIHRPAVTDFVNETHAQGIGSMLTADEPIIGRVIRDGTVALGQTASTQGGSWYEPCHEEIASAWTALASVFGYQAVVFAEPPVFPLEVHYGPLPYDVQSVAEVIARAVESP